MTAAVKKPENESEQDSGRDWPKIIISAITTFCALVGAGAAFAVFVLPTKDGRDEAARDNRTSTAAATQHPTNPSNPTQTTAPNERHLAELPLAQGGGAVQVSGRDLSMPCGSGQSDDQYRQIEYELPGPYTSFTTDATAKGKADVEASVGVQVFVRARQEKSDRTLEARRIALKANTSQPLTADVADARAILLRITCSASTLNVTFTDPRIGR